MNRRHILQAGLGTVGLAITIPALAAEPVPPPPPQIVASTDIGTNHGHEFKITAIEALQLLRSTKAGGPVQIDIRGNSSHGHILTIAHENLLVLFVDGQVQLKASFTGIHDHTVLIKLDVA